MKPSSVLGSRRLIVVIAIVAAMSVPAVVVAGGAMSLPSFTPSSADQITNLDILRSQIKNYYGAPLAKTGPSGTWADPLNLASNYAQEASGVAADGARWLSGGWRGHAGGKKAIVLDVDDTTLATWNYELYSNWDYSAGTNANFVTQQLFPAVPGMVAMVTKAAQEGYAVFWITGRPTSQYAATLGNLTSDGVGVDAGYPTPTTIDRTGAGDVGPGIFTKPSVGSYPSYLNKPEFCAAAIAAATSCATIPYKSGTRAYIESLGYDIVGDFGDQYSDLTGGYADKTFKLPNPNYYLP